MALTLQSVSKTLGSMKLDLLKEMALLAELEVKYHSLEKRVEFCRYYINYLQYDEEFGGKFICPPKKRKCQWK